MSAASKVDMRHIVLTKDYLCLQLLRLLRKFALNSVLQALFRLQSTRLHLGWWPISTMAWFGSRRCSLTIP
jgi:hypothetical protein